MKILIVTPYFAPKIGGLESYSLSIAKGMKQLGHEILVITSNHESKKRSEIEIDGIKIIRLPILLKLSNTPINPLWYFAIKNSIKNFHPDLINAHSPVPFMADMAILASKSTPTILTYHAGSMLKGGGLVDVILGIYEKHILTRLLAKVTKIIAINPRFIEPLVADKAKVAFIPPGIDTNVFSPDQAVTKEYDVLFVGRIEKSSAWKGIETLLKAIEMVKTTSHTLVKVAFVGAGDAISLYQKQAVNLKIDENVTFLGGRQGKELISAYNRSKMLVLPSTTDSESFGMVLIEAMACGLPVIGSRIGGIPNVINDHVTGVMVPPKNVTALADAMTTLISDEQLQRTYGQAGRHHVIAEFSAQQQIKKTEELFLEVTNA